jgi:hypothetical protein
MRRLLGLSLAIALGLTAVAAAPVAAATTHDDCTVVMTSVGRQCLTDRDLRLFEWRTELTDREMRSMVDCGCLSTREQEYLDRVLDDAGRMATRRVLRFMAARDCFADSDLQRLRRSVVTLDRDDLKTMVTLGGPCRRVFDRRMEGQSWIDIWRDMWRDDDYGCLSDPDLRRIDRRTTDLDMWDIRTILRYGDRRDCVTSDDVRRLDRRTDDLDLLDILDLFGGFDLR